MDDPLKIVFKYKNNNHRAQYQVYIFVGSLVSHLTPIFTKMQNLSLYDTWVKLESSEINKLKKQYGDYWYEHFFNNYHIAHTKNNVNRSNSKKTELINKFGKEWFTEHVTKHELTDRRIYYSYASVIKRKLEQAKKKLKNNIEEDELIDFNTDSRSKNILVTVDDKQTLSRSAPIGDDSGDESGDETSQLASSPISNLSDSVLESSILESSVASSDIESSDSDDSLFESDYRDMYPTTDKNVITGTISRKQLERLQKMKESGVIDVKEQERLAKELKEQQNKDDDYAVETFGKTLSRSINKAGVTGDKTSFDNAGMDVDDMLFDEYEDMKEIADMYKQPEVSVDKNIKDTTKMIQKAIKTSTFNKDSKLTPFDQSKNSLQYDELLKNVYDKVYITTQYLFRDDTIKTIKSKVCISMANDANFGNVTFLTPSRLYLWGEYFFKDKIEKVMIGHKWLRRNELLQVDTEPRNNVRVYEELIGNLRLLRDNIKRYGSKIKMEDDDYAILYAYDGYFSNNEIYMVDIYHELGMGYNPSDEAFRNISEVYMRLYFPKISPEDLKHIIGYLNKDKKVEEDRIQLVYKTINNDMIMENKIMNEVEMVKSQNKYQYIFKNNYVTQSVIHVISRMKNPKTRIDLHRIFNKFEVDENYPFVQYSAPNGDITYKYSTKDIQKYYDENMNLDILSKWFESAPYGISFKVRIFERGIEKFMAIGLTESGKIEYKTQWKEDDKATIDDTKRTYEYIRQLIRKLNEEKNRIDFEIPEDNEFRYAFINSIQQFELPNNFKINHNDLSEFTRYLYPYAALVIAPRKRQSKVKKENDSSKYGTYLRYKRVSKYENQARIEQRIIYFMRQYEYTDKSLSNEISKQFNITLERAMQEIENVRKRYPNIKRSRKVLKKLENIPKYKPPGIGIDVQGKTKENYKIRVSGARTKQQLQRILTFMNILIFLYMETYLYKRKNRQAMKETLKQLTNIAKRRNKVKEIVNHSKEIKTVKQMTKLDQKRIGYKPEKGQSQWTRNCQNSGNDKKRRPQQYPYNGMDRLLKKGYKLNKKTNMYEKEVIVKEGKKKVKRVIRTARLQGLDENGNPNGRDIHYACSPGENGEHMYIGFLTRSKNPFGQCMPCCFKKDPYISKNKSKRDYFLRCIGKIHKQEKKETKTTGDTLYILQDTNKIDEGRYGFLPKYLDFFFNYVTGKSKVIKNHYLLTSKSGYFFKLGTKQDKYPFLNAVSATFELTSDQVKEKVVSVLEKDRGNQIFTSLNNGDIRTKFGTREEYIDYIKTNLHLDFEHMNAILSIPGVLSKGGLNVVVFSKQIIVIRKNLEKDKIKEDFTILCQNIEDVDNIDSSERDTIFLIKENTSYYPIALVSKNNENDKNIKASNIFRYLDDPVNIVQHIAPFYKRNCSQENLGGKSTKKTLSAKETIEILQNLNNKDYLPARQVIDTRNKCKYIVTKNDTVIPVRPSGTVHNIPVKSKVVPLPPKVTIDRSNELYKLTKGSLRLKPLGLYYKKKTKKDANVVAVMTKNYAIIPTEEKVMEIDWINKNNFLLDNKPLYDKIDDEITGKKKFRIDDRIHGVKQDEYESEGYQLFRLEFSDFINREEAAYMRKRLIKIINNKKMEKLEKRDKIRSILYKVVDSDLYNLYVNKVMITDNQSGGKIGRLVTLLQKSPDIDNYEVNNDREICLDREKGDCVNNPFCKWSHNQCKFALTRKTLVKFISMISEELVDGGIKAQELLKSGDYFVSDIVDYSKFTYKDGQKILKSTNANIKKVLSSIFGKDNIPTIGKRRSQKTQEINYQQLNLDNPMRDMKEVFVQNIIANNNTIYRAYSNGFYWLQYAYYDYESRNLGYYSILQTNISNYFKSLVIDWLISPKRHKEIKEVLMPYISDRNKDNPLNRLIIDISSEIETVTNCVIELHVLSRRFKSIIYVYDGSNNIVYLFDNGIIYDSVINKTFGEINDKKFAKYKTPEIKRKAIQMRFGFMHGIEIPESIDVIYMKNKKT